MEARKCGEWELKKPTSENSRSAHKIVSLKNKSIATSGDYRNVKLLKSGKKISHGISLKTGRPKQNTIASVSVIADDCLAADAWATRSDGCRDEKFKGVSDKILACRICHLSR